MVQPWGRNFWVEILIIVLPLKPWSLPCCLHYFVISSIMIQYNCICGRIVSYMNDLISKPRWLLHCAREALFSKKNSFKIICPQIWKYTKNLHWSLSHHIKEFPHTWDAYVWFRMLFDITWMVSMQCKIHHFHVSLHCLRRERLDQDEDETKEKLKEEMNVEEETNEKTPLTDDTTVRMPRILDTTAGFILGISLGNERWCYNVTSSQWLSPCSE